MTATKTEQATAYHESGHIIAAYAMGLFPEWVSVEPTADARGMAFASGSDAQAQAVYAVAGPLSDKMFWGSTPASEQHMGWGNDFDTIESALATIHPHLKGSRDRGELLTDPVVVEIIRESKEIVTRNWPAIQSLANRLIAQRTISGPGLRSLLAVLCRPHESNAQTVNRLRKDVAELHAKYGEKKALRTVRAAGEAELFLYDEIGSFGVTAKEFANQLADLGDVSVITLRMNSPGGDAFDGVAMFNSLVQHSAHVTVRVDGLAASAASLVAMAGDRIEMADNAFLMVHAPWLLTAGNARELRTSADLLDTLTLSYVDTYANRRGLDKGVVANLLWDETWLSADEAIEAGFADEVLAVPAIAASVSQGRYERTPASLIGNRQHTPRRDAAERRMREMSRELVAA